LVVVASIEDVRIPVGQGQLGRGLIKIKIKQVLKGTYSESFLTFSDGYGGTGKGILLKDGWLKKWNSLKNQGLKIYLLNASVDNRYVDTGLKGWILADSWFGYEVI
jgi:hypothetical protein